MTFAAAFDQPTARGPAEAFTGTAWQQTIATGPGPAPLHVARVVFEPGSRTVWHTHVYGQILIAVSGVGRFQSDGSATVALRPGDSVTIAPGERHWHGAAPDQLFVHLSIQAADGTGLQATWLEPVSDEDFNRKPEKTT